MVAVLYDASQEPRSQPETRKAMGGGQAGSQALDQAGFRTGRVRFAAAWPSRVQSCCVDGMLGCDLTPGMHRLLCADLRTCGNVT
jgi:hypothetical protein